MNTDQWQSVAIVLVGIASVINSLTLYSLIRGNRR